MINLVTLKRQHEEISEIIEKIKDIIDRDAMVSEASEAALLISTLAGKLKIHLNTEDKYMYPQLMASASEEVRKTAKEYLEEMGTISETFMGYKDRFNTRSKICADPGTFAAESSSVFEVLYKRIGREEDSLYNFYDNEI